MNDNQRARDSKFLTRHLRHAPEKLGLTRQPGAWVSVADLLAGCGRAGLVLTASELRGVLKTNETRRFSFDSSGDRIRANQGHRAEEDLQLEPLETPAALYHGTTVSAASVILADGQKRLARHHVHLSSDVPTAWKVGSRRGKPSRPHPQRAGDAPRRDGVVLLRQRGLAGR